jgi:hypothetical protein
MKRAGGIESALFSAISILVFTKTGFGQAGNLDLRLTSEGKAVVARVYLHDTGGHSHRIPVKVSYSRFAEQHWIVDGAVQIPVSPGIYKLRVEKGPEYAIVERRIEIAPAQVERVALEIPHLVHMDAEGWYSGDLHIHRDSAEMPLLLRAEDLNVGPVITRHIGPGEKWLSRIRNRVSCPWTIRT